MTPERWQQIRAIFDDAVECDPASRTAFIRGRCAGDQELQREVESLLVSDRDTGSLWKPLLNTSASAAAAPDATVSSTAQNDSFGPYLPVRVLGEGGMGTVYLARQQHPIRREVALKVVKPGMDSRQVMERFESERQSLALMEYPNIARVLDAGTSERGRPYFVMEYVDGVPITDYCDRKTLGTRERLQLFVAVCNALQHAHQKGVIHRDVKPSNILVTEVDGKPVPKVIDFGIARATDQRLAEGEAFTLIGQIVGTPEYMSPEQAGLDGRDIDTGTDVYSLGIVLYELLAGALPLDLKALRNASANERLRAVREMPVAKPSARITQMEPAAEEIARRRSTNPGQLKRELCGDLDWIVMKAIEKDRHLRYASASEFAADIERYLKNEPVLAGPPDTAYRMGKFVTRHKRPVAAASAIVMALVAGIVTTAWQAHVAGQQRTVAIRERSEAQRQALEAATQRDAAQTARNLAADAQRTATKERDRALAAEGRAQQERNTAVAEKRRADKEAAIATAVNNFLRNDVLAQASPNAQARPGVKPDPELKVRTAVDNAAQNVAGKFDPEVEAAIRLTMGKTYAELGRYPEAQREIERALDLLRRALGEEDPKTLTAMFDLGELYQRQGQNAKAEPLAIKVLAGRRRVLGEEHPATAAAINDLGVIYWSQNKLAQAEPLLSKALQMFNRLYGAEHPETLNVMSNLGRVHQFLGNLGKAESFANTVLDVRRRVLGGEHPDTVTAMNVLGSFYSSQRKYAQSEALLTGVLEFRRRVLGDEHPDTLNAMNNVGVLYRRQGKYAEAEPFLAKVWEGRRRVLGESDPATFFSMNSLGTLYLAEGKYSEAEPLLSMVVQARRRQQGPQHPMTTDAMAVLAGALLQLRRYVDAESLLRDALANYEKLPDGWDRYRAQSVLGESLAMQRKYAEAEPLLLSGYRGLLQREGGMSSDGRSETEQAANRIVQLYEEWGRPQQATEWRSQLQVRKAAAAKQ